MEIFLVMNGMELRASVDEQEQFVLALAAGEVSREALSEWLRAHAVQVNSRS
jgi:death on curing protein